MFTIKKEKSQIYNLSIHVNQSLKKGEGKKPQNKQRKENNKIKRGHDNHKK